jgi:hypothetical protein
MKEKIEPNCIVFSNSKKDRYFAYSVHLNLVGFGRTAEEAKTDFETALSDFVSFHKERGTLQDKLISLVDN